VSNPYSSSLIFFFPTKYVLSLKFFKLASFRKKSIIKLLNYFFVLFFYYKCHYKEYYSVKEEIYRMDEIDRKILNLLQTNATLPLSELSRRVGISKTPCWNRIRKLEELGIINQRVTLLDRHKLGLPIVVFLSISVSQQSAKWATHFIQIISKYKQIIEVHRLTGSSADYMLKVVASSIEDYDKFQQILISEVEFTSMSSSVSLQEIKYNVSLPLNHLN
tara:strand:- start:1208 stop:1864 length:657 start_codon:yes stop_codon:yes gene_type:complete